MRFGKQQQHGQSICEFSVCTTKNAGQVRGLSYKTTFSPPGSPPSESCMVKFRPAALQTLHKQLDSSMAYNISGTAIACSETLKPVIWSVLKGEILNSDLASQPKHSCKQPRMVCFTKRASWGPKMPSNLYSSIFICSGAVMARLSNKALVAGGGFKSKFEQNDFVTYRCTILCVCALRLFVSHIPQLRSGRNRPAHGKWDSFYVQAK